jgi:eukaryotic-like serine/threonine-protein kinase
MTGPGHVLAGRYRIVSPLPPIGGVPRDLAVDVVAGGQVEVARFARRGAVPTGFSERAGRYQAVRHPCLAPIVAWTEPGDDAAVDPIVVEQHIDGARLAPGIALPRRSSLLVVADAADAVGALHAADLVHGALAPDAIVLDRSGRAIVLGAGTNRLQAEALGSELPAEDPAGDMQALGALLYTLVCGRPPAQPPVAPAEVVPDVEPSLNGLILSLLSDDPLRPPPPAAAVSLRLREMAGEPPVDLVGAVPVVVRSARRGPLPAAGFALLAAAAAIAILGVVAAFAVTRGKDEEASVQTVTTVSTTVITRAGGPPIISAVPASTVTITAGGGGGGPTTLTGYVTATAVLPQSVFTTNLLLTTTITHTGATTITRAVTETIPGATTTVTSPVTLFGF